MKRFLIVTWDGAGNLVPTLGIAKSLLHAGHHVRVLGNRSIDERCGNEGWEFRAFSSDGDSSTDEMQFMLENVLVGAPAARDMLSEFERDPADVVIADALMFGAISAAESLRVPTALLFHSPYSLFRRGPLLEMVSGAVPLVNALRAERGLGAIDSVPDLLDRCSLGLVASPREFESSVDFAPNVRFVGPVLDGPPLVSVTEAAPRYAEDSALVVVSFSTSQMGQAPLLQRIVDALAGMSARVLVTTGPAVDPTSIRPRMNTHVVGYVPHRDVLPAASVVITHAGLGTVMTSLAFGVPLVCTPMGRDQFFNASRVADLGAGCVLPTDASEETIAEAVGSVLSDPAYRNAARQMSRTIAAYGGGRDAVAELERIADL